MQLVLVLSPVVHLSSIHGPRFFVPLPAHAEIFALSLHDALPISHYLGVPSHIVNKQPSADLWKGQTDEEEMGTTYEKIDAYLKGKKIPASDEKIIEQMHERTKHKREPIKKFRRSDRSVYF